MKINCNTQFGDKKINKVRFLPFKSTQLNDGDLPIKSDKPCEKGKEFYGSTQEVYLALSLGIVIGG